MDPTTPTPDRIGLSAVNVGVPAVLADTERERVWSAIAKTPLPAATTLYLSLVNLAGDGQADLMVHGGLDKAVYAYPSEHLGAWATELDEELGAAPFGENLSTIGVTEADVCIGDVWAWGSAQLEVCQPRSPCFKLALHRRRPDIQQLLRRNGRTGWYLRVLRPGEVSTDGPITVARRDPLGLTVADAHRSMGDRQVADRELMQAVAEHPRLADEWRLPLVERLGRRA